MPDMKLAETIHELSLEHVRNGGLIMGQNLEAVQNVCGTVPVGEPGVEIMPTCEAAGIGMAIGAALTGRPVIHVIRFASFLWLQSSPIVYYAARAKSQWGYDLPLFIRVSSDDGIGPTHSGAYHSPFIHMPGNLHVVAPMTSGEYRECWRQFQETREPVLVSEQRCAYSNELETPTTRNAKTIDVLIIAISAARFAAIEALRLLRKEGVGAEIIHLWQLEPLNTGEWIYMMAHAREAQNVIIVDSTYKWCSFAEHLAYMLYSNVNDVNVHVLGMTEPPGVGVYGGPSMHAIANAAVGMVG
jgi:pyruvate/2-oxoglutarate/acetoin dehydrogenase E1 component